MIELTRIPKSDLRLRVWMADHYSKPRGFVGRQLIYLVSVRGVVYGATVAGSAGLFLPGRNEFFPGASIHKIVNNTFFHISKKGGSYPVRNFATAIVAKFRSVVALDWPLNYGDDVEGWETLVEPPRTGELYLRDGWQHVGTTKGFTCRRVAGPGTDDYSGARVWDTKNLHPKLVFARKL